MTTSQTMAASPMPDALRPFRRPHVFGNLMRKELRESRGLLIAGLWIFWAMPVCVQVLFAAAYSREHEMLPGFTWVPLILAGWLYAVVVGAHTVCRDWGKPEEHFLLGRPVSVRSIVFAKFMVGAAVVLLVLAVAGLWDVGVATVCGDWHGQARRLPEIEVEPFLDGAVLVICVFALGYVFAFAAAVITRQMLAGTLVASLALLLWLVGPLVSHRLQFLYPRFITNEYLEGRGPMLGTLRNVGPVFLGLVIVTIVVCVAVALFSSARERVIRVGHKPLAWAVALVVLTLFSAAMSEVGNSLVVCDEKAVPALELASAGIYENDFLTAQHGDRCFVLAASSRNADSVDWPLVTFRVNDRGHIEGLRTADLPNSATTYPQLRWATEFRCDAAGDLLTRGVRGLAKGRGLAYRSDTINQAVWQTRLAWPESGERAVLSHSELALPGAKRSENAVLSSWAATDTYAYLVYAFAPDTESRWDSGDKMYGWPTTLYVFSWSDGTGPAARHEIPLVPGSRVMVEDGRLEILKPMPRDPGATHREWSVARFDASRPESIGDAQSARYERSRLNARILAQWEAVSQYQRPGAGDPFWTAGNGVFYVSDRFGLRVVRDKPASGASESGVVGEYRASPLAMLSRAWGELALVDNSLLIEFVNSALAAYDVSDPAHPRRVGFLNTGMTGGCHRVFGTGGYLVLVERKWDSGGWRPLQATVLKRPMQRTPG